MAKKDRKIPITVLAGFLGSGKTTMLNHILTNNDGLKIGVIVNDFGDINIDSKLVASQTDSKLELSNGCICCSLGSLDLQEAIGQFVYPNSPIDYIIIEASGLAEPYDLLVTLRDSMNFEVRLDSIIAIIDAEHIEANAKAHPTALTQVQYSDFVIINKIDLVEPKKLTEIKQLVLAINPKARIFEAKHGKVDLNLILDTEVFEDREMGEHDHSHHAHEAYEHFSFSSNKPLHPMEFQQFVNSKIPTSIYRAKGIVDLGKKGGDRKYIFQLVGSRANIEWDNWNDDELKQTELVFIGKNVDKEKILQELEKCIDSEPDAAVPEGYEVRLPKRAS